MTPDAKTFGRRTWIALAVAAAVVVVVLSWRVPEPETRHPRQTALVENISQMRTTPQPMGPPPNYGTRSGK